MELIQRIERADQLAQEQDLAPMEKMIAYTGDMELDLDYEINLEMDEVILAAEQALTEAEKLREEKNPLDLQTALKSTEEEPSSVDFSFLNRLETPALTELFAQETPLVRALIISRLSLRKAEAIYASIKPQERFEVVWELGNLHLLKQDEKTALSLELQVKANQQGSEKLRLVSAPQSEVFLDDIFTDPLTLDELSKLSRPLLVETAHRMNLEDLMIALSHAPKVLKERMVAALDSARRIEFLQGVQGLRADLDDSMERQQILLDTAQAILDEQKATRSAIDLKQA